MGLESIEEVFYKLLILIVYQQWFQPPEES